MDVNSEISYVNSQFVPKQYPSLVTYSFKISEKPVIFVGESDISAKYGITSIPTLLFFKDGEIVDKHIGAASKSQLELLHAAPLVESKYEDPDKAKTEISAF